MKEPITSLQNNLVKYILRLQQKVRERKDSGLFVTEGRREISLALSANIKIKHLLICNDIYTEDEVYPINTESIEPEKIIHVSRSVYNKMAYRENNEGVILLGEQREHALNNIVTQSNPLVIILEGVEKPGNLGAVLRTADAVAADAVILVDPRTDFYSPNTLRASLGCVFTVPSAICTGDEVIEWLKAEAVWRQEDAVILAASLGADTSIYETSLTGPVALVFGAEDKGLSGQWIKAPCKPVLIPMSGKIDSLNLSASVAIVAFETVRQRKHSP